MEKSMFFNSVDRDRVYNADDLCLYLASLFESGVLKRDEGSLDITAGDGMQVIISSGYAFIDGHLYVNDDDKILNIDNADGVYNRIDSVVVRLDSSLRQITVELKKGQNSSNATVPNITRDGDIYELQLGYITVNKGIVSIEQAMITDTRDDTAVCGYVINNAEEGERLQKQIDQILSGEKTVKKAEYASKTERLSVGSKDNPDKTIAFYCADGTYYRLHASNGGFYIRKCNADGTTIKTVLTVADGISTVDNASKALSGFDIGSNTESNRMLKFFTGNDGRYYRAHAWRYNDAEHFWLELCDKDGNKIETALHAVDGVATVQNAVYASKTNRLAVGSKEEPNKNVAFYGADGTYYILQHGSDGNFYIRLCDTEGKIIKTVLKLTPADGLIADRAVNADNARNAPNGFDVGSASNGNKSVKLYTGHAGQYYRLRASRYDNTERLWIELCNSAGEVIATPLYAVDGIATVENARYASGTNRLAVGSKDNPNKNIAFYGADGSYFSIDHGTDGKFHIRKYAADGTLSKTVFTIDADGIAAFDNLSDYVSKEAAGLLTRPNTVTNVLSVGLDGTRNGAITVANAYSGGTSNCPYEPFMGTRVQYNISPTISFYLLYEAAPNPGNVWMQVHNQTWKDLVCISGRVNLWTGSITQGNAGSLKYNPYCFKHLELYFDSGALEFPMIVPVKESVYGSVALKGADSFSLIAGHFDLSANKIIVVVLGKLNITDGHTKTTAKLIRVDGVS